MEAAYTRWVYPMMVWVEAMSPLGGSHQIGDRRCIGGGDGERRVAVEIAGDLFRAAHGDGDGGTVAG